MEDLRKRFKRFEAGDLSIEKVALTLEQARQFNLPPQPLKDTDTRSKGYKEKFGIAECWECDALDPDVLVGYVISSISQYFDQAIREENLKEKEQHEHDMWEKYASVLSLLGEAIA